MTVLSERPRTTIPYTHKSESSRCLAVSYAGTARFEQSHAVACEAATDSGRAGMPHMPRSREIPVHGAIGLTWAQPLEGLQRVLGWATKGFCVRIDQSNIPKYIVETERYSPAHDAAWSPPRETHRFVPGGSLATSAPRAGRLELVPTSDALALVALPKPHG